MFTNMEQLENLVIENKGAPSSKRFENSQSFILDKILTKYLPLSNCKSLRSVTISGSSLGATANILSDIAAKDFFT